MSIDPSITARLKLDAGGLITAVVQDATSKDVLMVGWMDVEALSRTLETKRATFWSRSRQEYWTKGETSGNFLDVTEVRLDCDGDTVLVTADPAGPTCHTGSRTCFDNGLL
jgi:phosphoribosyl-AMP cyclohydrolase